ncbi:ABC transporter ATP-binding protein [Desulfospira joergensenii]|uniref:ABC transporter ATP-binding protein n=1 Tax=Desulfospira joergensenii TaxID=53329 RepID=UPI0003B36366|nr:ABC transporter ATP-binding protein [Desulfospira joergensenii]
MGKILEVKDLITRFHTFDGVVHALSGVSFDLEEGEILGVVGESGSGKSVTMMSLLHLLPSPPARIEGGRALYHGDGEPVDLLQLSKAEISRIRGGKIGFIFQDALSALNPVMTIGKQISETLIQHLGHTASQAKKRSIQLLEYVGIPEPEQRFSCYPHQFSGGMRQRAMIALAVACEPKIIIADEPTTALDVTVQAQIIELVQRLQKEMNMSVIWITHDLGVVAGMADRVLVMYAGTVVETARVEDLYYRPSHPYTQKLLGALPRMDSTGRHRLESIDGAPPDMLFKPAHCQFAWRCDHAEKKCMKEIPKEREISSCHQAACFFDFHKKEDVHER